jgi:hypothetical protein
MTAKHRDVDELLIPHLAAGKRHEEAARLVGVGVKTVYRRMQNPEFRARVEAERQALVEAIRGDLRRAGQQAVATLEALLVADDPKVRLGASKALLSLLLSQHPAPEPPAPPSEQGAVVEYVQRVIVTSETATSLDTPEQK